MDAPVLADGKVLIVGGTICCPYQWVNGAELYDPSNGTWTLTASKKTSANEPATLLPNGQVLVAGGTSGTQPTSRDVASAELYDPNTASWSATASMSIPRSGQTVTVLPNGEVLAAGGNSGGWDVNNVVASAELYNPTTGTWTPTTSMMATRRRYSPMARCWWLVAGGGDSNGNARASAELYVQPTATLTASRVGGTPFQTITVSGTTFGSNESVALYWDSATTPLSTVVTAADGSFQTPLTLPQTPAGSHLIRAVGQTSSLFGVTSFGIRPNLLLTPGTGPSGTTVVARGFGFGAQDTLNLYWLDWFSPLRLLGTTTSNALGTIYASTAVTFTVPTIDPGTYLVVAKGQRATGITAFAVH